MLRKNVSRSIIFIVTLALVLSSFGLGALAAPSNGERTEGAPQLAELFGDINLSSPALTTVIVELVEESIVEAKHKGKNQSKGKLATERGKVVSELKSKVGNATVNREYDYVFSGFSVELPANQIPQLLATSGVKAVYPDVQYTVTGFEGSMVEQEAYSPNMMDSAPFIGADQAWNELGITGAGVTVAVIDTGADYTHPDLAHAFGDYKGWDFVDNDNDPQETPAGDPRGGSTAHGTHVSGTVAANGLIKGVAPDATLLAYRVLGPGGRGTTTNVVAGIERAVQDGADVMNLSLGNTLNNPDWATSIALDWAMAEGVVAVTSNGNSGPNNWTVGSPGTSRQAISVGATQLPYNVYNASLFTSEGVDYPTSTVMGFVSDSDLLELNGNTYEYVYVGLGNAADFEGKDVEGKIALISRGAIPFVTKATNAANAGAVGAIIFNSADGEFNFIIPGMAVPTIKLSGIDGQKMLAELEAGHNEVTFDIAFSERVGETMAGFSSRGPVIGTWMIKPDVSAPGVNITSTVPTHNPDSPHGYAAYQGTSMSAPHVAGAAALLLQAHPTWSVDQVKAALMNTAENLIDPATGKVYAHNSQGAGSIRIMDAIQTNTLALPGSHSFGTFLKDSGKQVEEQSFTVQNLSSERKVYSFDAQFNGNPDGIKVMTSNNTTVPGNSTQKVNFNVQVDASKLAAGYYEGIINVSDGTQTIEVPTILFVQEPDYKRITHAGFTQTEDGYDVWVYLPTGAEAVDIVIYRDSPWGFAGVGATYTNLPKEYNDLFWDGKVGGQDLATGVYHMYIFAEKAGKTDYVYAGKFEVTE
jgi:minor extracellular serine protease Vpr